MNYARLESRICLDEGYRGTPYLDTVGVPTIGYGTTRILGEPVTMAAPPISEEIARQLLRMDLFGACLDAQAVVSRFGDMGDVHQEVLANMAYNLGRTRLAGFTRMLAALERLDFDTAANEMVNSAWYTQVRTRAARLVDAMRTGRW